MAAVEMTIRSDGYHRLALDGDIQGVDRNSIENDLWVNVVDIVILAFTIIGAGSILISMLSRELRGRAATVRTRLVQGLVASDFMLGLVAMVTSTRKLQGKGFKSGTQACDGFGVLLVAVLWTEHLWTLALAFATYMILIYPLSRTTRILERRWPFLYIIIWSVAFGVAVMGYELYGYWASGGLCYYGSNSGLYGELVQFIPRAFVFVSIVFFYARLYVFLRRPDRIKASFSNSGRRDTAAQQSDPEYTYQSATSSMLAARAERHKAAQGCSAKAQFAKFSFKKRNEDKVQEMDEKKAAKQELYPSRQIKGQEAEPSSDGDGTDRSRSGSDQSKASEIPPWEKLELPVFQIDGQRYGGSSSTAGSSRPGSGRGELKPFGKKIGGGKRPTSSGSSKSATSKPIVQKAYPRDRTRSPPAALPIAQTNSKGQVRTQDATSSLHKTGEQSSSLFRTYEGMAPKTIVTAPSPKQAMEAFPAPSSIIEEDNGASAVFKKTRPHPGNLDIAPDQQIPTEDRMGDQIRDLPAAAPVRLAADILTPSTTASSRPLIDRNRQPSLEHSQLVGIRRDSVHAGLGDTESRRGSGPVSFVLPPSHKEERSDDDSEGALKSGIVPDSSTSRAASRDEEVPAASLERGGEEEDDDDMDFAQMLAASYPGGPPTGSRHDRASSEDTEFIQESTSSYLNRKTAMLMLYFPLAYCLLFSVSLIRIIFDFTDNGAPKPLRVIARWFIFSQGAVDAIIYGIVEVNVKRGVRKKVKKGLISPGGSRPSRGSWGGDGTGSANMLSGFLSKKRATSQGPQIDVVDNLRSSN